MREPCIFSRVSTTQSKKGRTGWYRFILYSSSYMFNAQCVGYQSLASYVYMRGKSPPSPFLLFWVSGYAHTQLGSSYPLSTFDAHAMKNKIKYQALSLPAQLQCSCSETWEPGNETYPMIMITWPVYPIVASRGVDFQTVSLNILILTIQEPITYMNTALTGVLFGASTQ